MAIRTAAHPDGFGAPPTSPLVIEFRDIVYADGEHVPENVWMTRLSIPYDNTTKFLQDPIDTYRDPLCKWTTFVVGPSTDNETHIPVPGGTGSIAVVDLGVATLPDLETAGFAAIE